MLHIICFTFIHDFACIEFSLKNPGNSIHLFLKGRFSLRQQFRSLKIDTRITNPGSVTNEV